MFIEASVTPAKASRSASRGLIGKRPPKKDDAHASLRRFAARRRRIPRAAIDSAAI